jgi:gliding motility associated protien GldN
MMGSKLRFILFAVIGAFCFEGYAQEDEGYMNPNSLYPIPKYEQLFKRRVWRYVDLREKQNKGFFAKDAEITKFMIEMINSGELADKIYNPDDSLKNRMTKEDFLDALISQEGMEYDAWNQDFDYWEGDQVSYGGKVYTSRRDDNRRRAPSSDPEYWEENPGLGKPITYMNSQMTKLEIMEDVIFDKRRSRLYHDIQALKIIIPGSETPNQLDKPVAQFRYKDLEELFRAYPEKAIWFNRQNSAEHKNFADAFLLRLFSGTIVRVENPDNLYIEDIYNSSRKESVMAQEWMEMQLMEKEHNLWEY